MIYLAKTVQVFTQVIIYLLLARAVMSWVVRDWSHPLPRFIYDVTEPLLMPMRSIFQQFGLMGMGIDFSFLATFLLIQFIGNSLTRMLYMMAF